MKRKSDADYLLEVLEDGRWHNLNEILDRSQAERGRRFTAHSRAADLRKRGHVIEVEVQHVDGYAHSRYRLLSAPRALEEAPLSPSPARGAESSAAVDNPVVTGSAGTDAARDHCELVRPAAALTGATVLDICNLLEQNGFGELAGIKLDELEWEEMGGALFEVPGGVATPAWG